MNSTKPKITRKAKIDIKSCVACGSCVKVCPKAAIKTIKGKYAQVHEEKCIGCSKCKVTCPASVIEIEVTAV
ncbi:MAG: ATP-binding protein [Eubacteriales bacterium]